MRTGVSAVLAALALLAAAPTGVQAARYAVAPGGDTEIVFTSKAPLESFDGRTNQVSGWIEFDPADLTAAPEFVIAVDLASFDTGNRKRNGHMRDNHLETDTYPQAWLRGGTVLAATPAVLGPGGAATVRLRGELDLHGVVQPLECEVRLVHGVDGALVVEASFPVSLAAHAIERPQFLVMKLADEQRVRVNLVARPEAKP